MAHIRQSAPDFGLGFQVKVLKIFGLGFQVNVLKTGSLFVLFTSEARKSGWHGAQ